MNTDAKWIQRAIMRAPFVGFWFLRIRLSRPGSPRVDHVAEARLAMIAQPGVQLGSRDREVECARGRMRVDRKRAPAHRVGAGSERASETDDHNLLVRRIVDGLAHRN